MVPNADLGSRERVSADTARIASWRYPSSVSDGSDRCRYPIEANRVALTGRRCEEVEL